MKNVITLDTTKGLIPELSFVEAVNQNIISIDVLNIGTNPKIEIYYGCDFKELTGMDGNEFIIPSKYCSDNEIIHFRYIDDDSESKFVNIIGDESAYENLKLIQKSSYMFFCSGIAAQKQEIDYMKKLAELISPITSVNEKSCYDDLFQLEELFNKQLARLGGSTGETVSESVQHLSDIEIPSQKGNQFLNFSAESLYIKDFIVRGAWTTGSYWEPSQSDIFRPNDKTWEIGVKILVYETTEYSQVLFGSNDKGQFYLMPSLEVQPNSRRLWAGISFNGTAWDLGASSEKELNTRTWSYIKYLYDGTNYIVKVSTDLINWETYISFEATGLSAFLSNLMFSGIALSSAHLSTRIWFDLRWNYIKIDNEYIFGSWYE